MFRRKEGRYNSDFGIDDFYDWYSATVPDPLPKGVFKDIFRTYIERIMLEIIYNSFEFNMGSYLGSIRIRDKDYVFALDKDGNIDKRKLAPDWGRTLKKWKKIYADIDPSEWKNIENKPIIYHENNHTDQKIKQWFWDKSSCLLPNQSAYKFNATRYWDRLVAKVNKETNITYWQ